MPNINTANDLLNFIFEKADEIGLSDKDLANQSDLTPVGLSKAKARGDMRLSNIINLLDTLRVDIILKPRDDSREDAINALLRGELGIYK